MRFGTDSTTELTQMCEGQSTNDIRICVIPDSVSLASLAHQIHMHRLTCMYTYIHSIHDCMYTFMHTYTHTYIHAYMHTYVHMHTCTHTQTHTHTYIYIYYIIQIYVPQMHLLPHNKEGGNDFKILCIFSTMLRFQIQNFSKNFLSFKIE